MTIGSAVILKEAVIVVKGLARAILLPKGTQGVVRARNGRLMDLEVDGIHYADIPVTSVEVIPAVAEDV